MLDVTVETIRKSLKNFQGGNISKGLEYLHQASYCLLVTGTGVIGGGTSTINPSNHPERQEGEEILNIDHVEEDQEGCCDDAIKSRRRSGLRLTRGMDHRLYSQRSHHHHNHKLRSTTVESQSELDTDETIVTDIHERPLPLLPTSSATSILESLHSETEDFETMYPFAQSTSAILPHEEMDAKEGQEEEEEEEEEERVFGDQSVVESIIHLIKYLTNNFATIHTQHPTDNIFPFPINQPIIHQEQIISFLAVCFDQLINHQRLSDERLQCLLVELLGDVLVQIGRYSDAFQYFLFCIDTLERLLSSSLADVSDEEAHHLLPWSSVAERLLSLLYKVDCVDVLQFMTLFKCSPIDGQQHNDIDGFCDNQLYRFQRNSQVITKFIQALEELGDFYLELECNLAQRMRFQSKLGKASATMITDDENAIEDKSDARFLIVDSKAIFCYEQIVKILSRPNTCLETALQTEIQVRIRTKMDKLNAVVEDYDTDIPLNDVDQSNRNHGSGGLLRRKYQSIRDKLLSLLAAYKQKCHTTTFNSTTTTTTTTTTDHSNPIQVSRDIIQRCQNHHTINQQWTNDIRILLRDIMTSIEDRIGLPPFDLKYCIVLLGSYGREEACPYSDLEIGVIYSNESHDLSFNQLILQYFTVFFRFFEMAIAWIARDCPFLQPMVNRHSVTDDPSSSNSGSIQRAMKMKKKKGFRLDPNHQPLSSYTSSNSSVSLLFEVQDLIATLQGKDNGIDILTNDVENKKQKEMNSLILSSLFHSAMRLKGDIYFYEEFLYQLPLLHLDDLERFQRYVHHIDLLLEDYLAKSLLVQKQHDQWLLSLSTSLSKSSSSSTSLKVNSHLVHAKTEYLFLFTLIDELCQRHQIVHNPNSEYLHGGGGLIERLQALQEKELIHVSLAQGLQLVALFLLRLRFELHFFYEDDRDEFLSYDATLSYEYQYEQLIEDTSMNSFFVLRPDDNRLWSHYRSYLHTLLMKIHSCISEEDLMMNLHALDLRVIARFWLLRIDCELERLMEIQELNRRSNDDDDCDSGNGVSQFMRNTTIQQYFLLAERCNSKLTEDVTLGDYIQNYVLSKLSLMV